MSSKIYRYIFLLSMVVCLKPNTARSETFYQLIPEKTFKHQNPMQPYSTKELDEKRYMSLLTWEMIQNTEAFIQPQKETWLLLKLDVPNNDTLLKWKTEEGCSFSQPVYFGKMPHQYVIEKYLLKPNDQDKLKLPRKLLREQKKPFLMPGMAVNKLLRYERWQNKKRLYKIQNNNLALPVVRLQWWYFDFFLDDSSTMVFAFIPQQWWGKDNASGKAMCMLSHRTKDGIARKFSFEPLSSDIIVSKDTIRIGKQFLLCYSGKNENRKYSIQLNFPEVSGVIRIAPVKGPYAPWPTGVMPGYLQTFISGAPKGSPSFSYVSQVPQGISSGTLKWDNQLLAIDGKAYHEQGRLDDTPESQGVCWFWYHFVGEGWNIFGSPGTCIYVQEKNEVLRSGFHLVPGDYTMQQKIFSSPAHPKMLTGGTLKFSNKGLEFELKLDPGTAQTMVSYTSPDPNQVWGTVAGDAQLLVQNGKEKKIVKGRMLLETCSWAKVKVQ